MEAQTVATPVFLSQMRKWGKTGEARSRTPTPEYANSVSMDRHSSDESCGNTPRGNIWIMENIMDVPMPTWQKSVKEVNKIPKAKQMNSHEESSQKVKFSAGAPDLGIRAKEPLYIPSGHGGQSHLDAELIRALALEGGNHGKAALSVLMQPVSRKGQAEPAAFVPPPPQAFVLPPEVGKEMPSCPDKYQNSDPHSSTTVSVGSLGHPDSCAPACKFNRKKAGCKDGALCGRCHLCHWTRSTDPATRYANAGAKEKTVMDKAVVTPISHATREMASQTTVDQSTQCNLDEEFQEASTVEGEMCRQLIEVEGIFFC